jgi:hypothetical protein
VAHDPFKRKLQAKKRVKNETFKRLKDLQRAKQEDAADDGREDDARADQLRIRQLMAEAGLDQPAPRKRAKKRALVPAPSESALVPPASAPTAAGDDDEDADDGRPQRGGAIDARFLPVDGSEGEGGGVSARGEKRARKAERTASRLSQLQLQRSRWEEELALKQEARALKDRQIDEARKRMEDARKVRHVSNGKLSQRTKRGQPVMRHQIDHLLAQVERAVAR